MSYKIEKLSDLEDFTGTPTDGQSLTYASSATKWNPSTISSGGGSSVVKGYCFYNWPYGGLYGGNYVAGWGWLSNRTLFNPDYTLLPYINGAPRHYSTGLNAPNHFLTFVGAGASGASFPGFNELHKTSAYDGTYSGLPTRRTAHSTYENIVIKAGSKLLFEVDISAYITDTTQSSTARLSMNVMTSQLSGQANSPYVGTQDATLASACNIKTNEAIFTAGENTTERLFMYCDIPAGHDDYTLGWEYSMDPVSYDQHVIVANLFQQNAYSDLGSNYQRVSNQTVLHDNFTFLNAHKELISSGVTIPEGPILRITQFN
jgi:hypothetical protein